MRRHIEWGAASRRSHGGPRGAGGPAWGADRYSRGGGTEAAGGEASRATGARCGLRGGPHHTALLRPPPPLDSRGPGRAPAPRTTTPPDRAPTPQPGSIDGLSRQNLLQGGVQSYKFKYQRKLTLLLKKAYQ